MRIHSISTVLAVPLLLCAAYVWFYMDHYDPKFLYYFIPPIIALVLLYLSYAQIDYWWHKRFPLPLDDRLKKWLDTYDPFYKKLNKEQKDYYEYRIGLYLEARAFKSVGREQYDLPEDVKVLFAATAVKMTIAHEDFLVGDYDRIFAYKHPFPTPKHQYLHTVETDAEDGVLIFALDYAVKGFTAPQQYYNIVMHGYAEAFVEHNSSLHYPVFDTVNTEAIKLISGFTYQQIADTIGIKNPPLLPILIVQYFDNPVRLKQVTPEVFASLDAIFAT